MYVLCANFKRGLVEVPSYHAGSRPALRMLPPQWLPDPPLQVWSLEDPEWHCRIDEGAAGHNGDARAR